MWCDAVVGESRADEPGLGPGASCKDAVSWPSATFRAGQAISECRLQIADLRLPFHPLGAVVRRPICNILPSSRLSVLPPDT